jgi:hypothetical protein
MHMLMMDRSLYHTVSLDFPIVAKEMLEVSEIRDKLYDKTVKTL